MNRAVGSGAGVEDAGGGQHLRCLLSPGTPAVLRSLRNGQWPRVVAGGVGGALGRVEAAREAGPTAPAGSVPGAHATWRGPSDVLFSFKIRRKEMNF